MKFETLSQTEKHKVRRKYSTQKWDAGNRNIEWNFNSVEEWYNYWVDSGHWHERGNKRGQYVMSRYNDIGPYSIYNTFFQPTEENVRQGSYGKKKPGTSQKLKGHIPWNKGITYKRKVNRI